MKSIVRIITILGLSHLLALLGVGGWLVATQRRNAERLESIREMLHEPAAPQTETDEELEETRLEEAEIDTGVPLSAAAALEMHIQEEDMHRERIARLQREVRDLSSLLTQMRGKLEDERTAFIEERQAYQQTRAELMQTEGQEQFRKALGVLSSLKPDQAKTVLSQLIQDGTFQGDFAAADAVTTLSGKDQAVSYLDALPTRLSGKILDAFIEDDPQLASELLERLRTRGQVALASEG